MSSRARSLAWGTLLAALSGGAYADAQQDPRLRWRTLETPHFHIHYYQDMERVARRVAEVGEAAHARLAGPLGWSPSTVTQIVLSDDTDDANGSATAVPLNTIRLYVTAPDDLSVLNQYDDWLSTLVTHEYTHILHTDNITGVPAIIDAIIGKQWAPNQVQPRWILEGLATYEESLHTHGGRLRSSVWDMHLRADALAGTTVTLDQLATGPNRWPHGHIWYLYGSYLMQYVADRFGRETLRELSAEYGSMVAPWQLNRVMHRLTGRTWEELYDDFTAATVARYRQQERAIRARGVEEGAPLTHQGETVRAPRFLPDGSLVYESTDGQTPTQLRVIDARELTGATRDHLPQPRTLDLLGSGSGFGVTPDGALIVSDLDAYRDIHFYHDLYRWTLTRDGAGRATARDSEQLTHGWRAQQPDVSPDGDHVAFTVNHRGTTSLFEMSLTDRRPRALFRPRRFEQAYGPRYSPDGRTIAFSYWRAGGLRDVVLIDRATGRTRDVTRDAAIDMSPAFSPDGRWLVWSSDRSGVMNLYAREVRGDGELGPLRQVTNVVTGAFQPAVSPDGRTLVYVSYSQRGFDLARLPFDPARWRDPDEPFDDPFDREAADAHASRLPPFVTRDHEYSPLATMRPRTWSAEYFNDGFGPQVAVRTQGSDIVGRHVWSARLGVGLVRGDPWVDTSYVYRGARPTLRLRFFRTVDAGGGYRVGSVSPEWAAERIGGESEVSVAFPSTFESHTLALTYDASYVRAFGGLPDLARYLNPSDAPPVFPFQGWSAGLRLSWWWSRLFRFAYSISTQEGVSVFATVRVSDPILGSAGGSVEASAGASAYIPMPWGMNRRRHVLALHLGAGVAVTDAGERGVFALGGFPAFNPLSLLDTLRTGAQSGGIALRGYPQFARVGSQYELLNVEYRFPVVQVQRGASTFPFFIQRVSGDVFVDVGYAGFGRFNPDLIAVGAGLEALIDIVVGYVVPLSVRVGYGKGFMEGGTDQVYSLLGSFF